MWGLGNFFQKIINMYTPLLGELEYVENGKKIFPSFCNLQLQLLFRVAYISTWGI